jgi:hypothetical protein
MVKGIITVSPDLLRRPASSDPKGTDSVSSDPEGAGSVSPDPEGTDSVSGENVGLTGARTVSNCYRCESTSLEIKLLTSGRERTCLDVTRGRDRPCQGTHDAHSVRQADTMPPNSCTVSVKGACCPYYPPGRDRAP